ncbi:MAG: hypothetical protein V2A58_03360 [Planctomycetota bacterium]
MLLGMLSILFVWTALAFAFVGLGLQLLRALGDVLAGADRLICAFWAGWAGVILFLQLWHCFAPVGPATLAVVLVAGLVTLLVNRQAIRFLKFRTPFEVSFLVTACAFGVWLANHAMGPMDCYDAGLYHLSSIRWITSYRIVPGLGNLHGRLAYNSAYFPYLALTQAGPWQASARHLGNGLLLLVLALMIELSIWRLWTARANVRSSAVLLTMLMVPVARRCFMELVSTSPDLPVFVIGALVSVYLWCTLFAEEPYDRLHSHAFMTMMLSAIGVTIKLSFLAFGATASILALLRLVLVRRSQTRSHPGKPLFILILLPLLAVAIWMARGVVLSGYLAYPVHYASFNVPWRVPLSNTILDRRWIESWARLPQLHPDEVLGKWTWFAPWVKRMWQTYPFDVVAPLLAAVVGLVLWLALRGRKDTDLLRGAGLLAPCLASLSFWFLTSPDPRFLGAASWALAAGALALAARTHLGRWGLAAARAVVVATVLATAGTHWTHEKIIDPGPRNGFYPIPTAEVRPFVADSGLTLFVPVSGDQCWDAPLPCTPYPHRGLSLRDKQSPARGFIMTEEPAGRR